MIIDDLTKQQILDAQQGSCEAFEYIYNKFYKEVYSIARYILKNDNKAEDVLQETFVKVYHKLPELKNTEAFSSWLYIITQNECRMLMRKKDESLLYLDVQENEYALLVDTDSEIEACPLDKEDDRLFIRHEVEKLPIQQRTAIVYFYYLNMPVKEIAKLLSCNENTIKSRLFAGRSALKKSIAKFQEHSGTTLSFSVLSFSRILGSSILEQNITKGAAKAIFASISGSAGLSIGHGGILWRLKGFMEKSARKAAGAGALAIILILVLGISGVAAAGFIMSDVLNLNQNSTQRSISQIDEATSNESMSGSADAQESIITPSTTPASNEISPSASDVLAASAETRPTEKRTSEIESEPLPAKATDSPAKESGDSFSAVPTGEITPTAAPSPVISTVPVPTSTAAPTPTTAPVPTISPAPQPVITGTPSVTPTSTPIPSVTPAPTVPASPTAGDIASGITGITSPAKGDVYLTLPGVPAGYSIAIKSSGDESVIALDGKITPVDIQQTVAIILTVTKTEDRTTADTASVNVIVPHFLSSNAELFLSSYPGTKLAGADVMEDTSVTHQVGTSESNQTLLIVTITSANIKSANFQPVVDHATVTAVTATSDSSSGGIKSGDYISVQTNTYDFTSQKFLWIKVVSEDLSETRYYSLYVIS